MQQQQNMLNFQNYIKNLDANQLRAELKELYSSYEVVRKYYEIKWKGNAVDKAILEQYKSQITTALYPDERMNGGFDYQEVEHILEQLNSETTLLYYIEAGLFAVEECTNVANEFGGGDEDMFIYFEELFEQLVAIIQKKDLASKYNIYLQEIARTAFDGYGHYDQLNGVVSDYF